MNGCLRMYAPTLVRNYNTPSFLCAGMNGATVAVLYYERRHHGYLVDTTHIQSSTLSSAS